MFIFPAGTTCLFLRKKQTGFQMLDWSSEMFCPKTTRGKTWTLSHWLFFPGGVAKPLEILQLPVMWWSISMADRRSHGFVPRITGFGVTAPITAVVNQAKCLWMGLQQARNVQNHSLGQDWAGALWFCQFRQHWETSMGLRALGLVGPITQQWSSYCSWHRLSHGSHVKISWVSWELECLFV